MATGPRPLGPYTPIVRAGDWLVCSGQLGLSGSQLVEGGVTGQITQAFANLASLLSGEGASLADVTKMTVFLTDMADFSEMNDAYVACLGDHRPARTAVAVAALPLGAVVEIEAWTWIGAR